MIVTKLNTTQTASLVLLMGAIAATAQTPQIRATFAGSGSADTGKCTIEVEIDGAADVEISGDQARMRTLSGSPGNFRRMECSGPLPNNAADFRFEGIDGRGSQHLLRDPRQGGPAVVRLEDRDSGRHGYTFDIFWSNRGNFNGNNNGGFGNNGNFPNSNGGFNGSRGGVNRGNGNSNNGNWNDNGNWNGNRNNTANGLSSANAGQAMRACQNEVANRIHRNGFSDIQFLRAEFDNNNNRADTISGTVRAQQTFGNNRIDFVCRVDLATGRLFDVRLDKR